MRQLRTVLGLLVAAALAPAARGNDVVLPSPWAAIQGPDNNSFPFGYCSPSGAGRYQQVYAASDFLASGVVLPITITALSFRPGRMDLTSSYPLDGQTLSLTIDLSASSSPPDALSSTFAANASGTATTVYSGPLTLPPVGYLPGPGPYPFVWTIPLQTPYVYTGTSDLLLDISIFGSSVPCAFTPLDAVGAVGDAVSRQVSQGNPSSATADFGDSTGLITRITYGGALAPFGDGCAGAGGYVPAIGSTGGIPELGNSSFAIALSKTSGGGSAVLVLGASDSTWLGVPLPFDLAPFGAAGCLLRASGDVLIGVPVSGSGAGAGLASVPTPIPANPSLSGGRAFAQWVPFDPILGGIRVSNAATITIY
jgi:hypothetical protein